MDITTTVKLTPQRVSDLFVGAFEGGSNYWMQSANIIVGKERKEKGLVWWGAPAVFQGDYSFKVSYENPEKGPTYVSKTLTQDDVAKGAQIMAQKYPEHFADIVQDNEDAITADVFMQCIVLGEIVYG